MNKIIIVLTDCTDCQYCDNNGLLQKHPKYICQHRDVPTKCDYTSIKYWYKNPVLGEVGKDDFLPIPDWCPRLLENK